jgi:methyltransferase-like protein/2-polyprenyl-3-methyl-5-hydroxy-6-metoxy-1,4-benzoquinol methylase
MAAPTPSLASYDAVPYRGRAISDTHPDALGAMAAVHGLQPPLSQTARVLELGCASAVNLMAIAAALPGTTCVGVDGSRLQIDEGERLRAEAGLANVRLIAGLFESLGDDLGEFDYVICHGVYSWVPHDVQDRLLALCRSRLAPGGLAFLSYNVYPGWHTRQMLREMMLFHVRAISEPAERVAQARALLELLARMAKVEDGTYRAGFATMAEHLADSDDGYIFHEFLEDENRPAYFHQVVERAHAAGLRYVGSTSSIWEAFPPTDVEEALAPLQDRVVREQYLDFLADTTFRRSVFCRDDERVRPSPDPSRVRALFASAKARPYKADQDPDVASESPLEFVTGGPTPFPVVHPLVKATFVALSGAMPRTLTFDELWKETVRLRKSSDAEDRQDELARLLLRSFTGGLVRLSPRPSPCAWPPPARPMATKFARVEAAHGPMVTNLFHRTVELSDVERLILRACDGSRTRDEIADGLVEAIRAAEYSLTAKDGNPIHDSGTIRIAAAEGVEEALLRIARNALLVAPEPGD